MYLDRPVVGHLTARIALNALMRNNGDGFLNLIENEGVAAEFEQLEAIGGWCESRVHNFLHLVLVEYVALDEALVLSVAHVQRVTQELLLWIRIELVHESLHDHAHSVLQAAQAELRVVEALLGRGEENVVCVERGDDTRELTDDVCVQDRRWETHHHTNSLVHPEGVWVHVFEPFGDKLSVVLCAVFVVEIDEGFRLCGCGVPEDLYCVGSRSVSVWQFLRLRENVLWKDLVQFGSHPGLVRIGFKRTTIASLFRVDKPLYAIVAIVQKIVQDRSLAV